MGTPKVSVLLPVRNGGPWLEDSLASLARQTLRTFEVIAVDDGSTDGSESLLDRWAANDTRFTVIHRQAQGLVAALNHGLDARHWWRGWMPMTSVTHGGSSCRRPCSLLDPKSGWSRVWYATSHRAELPRVFACTRRGSIR